MIRNRLDGSFIVVGADNVVDRRTASRLARHQYYGATASERFFSAAGSEYGDDTDYSSIADPASQIIQPKNNQIDGVLDEKSKFLFSCQDTCLRVVDELFRLAFSEEIPWKQLTGFEDCAQSVCSLNNEQVAAEFRINAPTFRAVLDVDASFELLRRVLIDQIGDLPKWHPFVPESILIERLSPSNDQNQSTLPDHLIEITYQTSQPALGGFVSARDFINLRNVGIRDGVVFGASIGTAHKSCPVRFGFILFYFSSMFFVM